MKKLITWFEIPVFDFKRGLFFYSKVFRHLEFDITEFNGIPHAIFKNSNTGADFIMAGALVEYKKKPESGHGPVLFFDANLGMDDILKRIEQNGGTIVKNKTLIKNQLEDGRTIIPKTLIDGNVGYYAYFTDSEGNKMGLYSNG
ncbi:MAG TPA: hypothetical protein VNZ49_04190 [Bacteroidia bacterium]|jgi:predicted enzyme related to lactoylglutathione lyase|nr:hypothetical protein [Bacteroidia bacterium]